MSSDTAVCVPAMDEGLEEMGVVYAIDWGRGIHMEAKPDGGVVVVKNVSIDFWSIYHAGWVWLSLVVFIVCDLHKCHASTHHTTPPHTCHTSLHTTPLHTCHTHTSHFHKHATPPHTTPPQMPQTCHTSTHMPHLTPHLHTHATPPHSTPQVQLLESQAYYKIGNLVRAR